MIDVTVEGEGEMWNFATMYFVFLVATMIITG